MCRSETAAAAAEYGSDDEEGNPEKDPEKAGNAAEEDCNAKEDRSVEIGGRFNGGGGELCSGVSRSSLKGYSMNVPGGN